MPPMASSAALKNLVAELAATTPEDVAAVLAMLDPTSATKVRSLLKAYIGMDAPAMPEAILPRIPGLSSWLAARVLGKTSDDAGEFHMTPTALSALRTLAASIPSQRTGMSTPSAPPARDDGLGRLSRRTSSQGLKA